jgi:hemolysin activation/secretion protein
LNTELTRPLLRTLRDNLYGGLGFERVQQRTKLGGAGGSAPLNLDRISTAYVRFAGTSRRLRLDGTAASDFGGFVELRKGLDLFDATETGVIDAKGYAPSRFEGNARAFVVRGQFDAQFGLGPVFELAGQVRGQWTKDPLLNYDEFSIGNLTVGRGYDPGANTGDRAYSTSLELRANVPTGRTIATQVYGFYEGIRLWTRRCSPERAPKSRRIAC